MPPERPSREKTSENNPADLDRAQLDDKINELDEKIDQANKGGNFDREGKLKDRQIELKKERKRRDEGIEEESPESQENVGFEEGEGSDSLEVPDAPVQKETPEERREKINKVKEDLGMEADELEPNSSDESVSETEAPPAQGAEQARVQEFSRELQQIQDQMQSAETPSERKNLEARGEELIQDASTSLTSEEQAQLLESLGANGAAEDIRENPDTTLQDIRERQEQRKADYEEARGKVENYGDQLQEAINNDDLTAAKQAFDNVYSVVSRNKDVETSGQVRTSAEQLARMLTKSGDFSAAYDVADKLDNDNLKQRIENTEKASIMKESGRDLANQEIEKIHNAERLDDIEDPEAIISVVDQLQDIVDDYAQADDMNDTKQSAVLEELNEKQSQARETAQNWLESAFSDLKKQSQEIVDSWQQAVDKLPKEPDPPVSFEEALAYRDSLQEATQGSGSQRGLAAMVNTYLNKIGPIGDLYDKRDQIQEVRDKLEEADPGMHLPELRTQADQKDQQIVEGAYNEELPGGYDLSPMAQIDNGFTEILPDSEELEDKLSQADELVEQKFANKINNLSDQITDVMQEYEAASVDTSLAELQDNLEQARQERQESWFGGGNESDEEKRIQDKIDKQEAALSEARGKLNETQEEVQKLRSQLADDFGRISDEFSGRITDLRNSLTEKQNNLAE